MPPVREPTFDPGAILAVLARHGVRVLIGGIAAIARGAHVVTEDLDVTPARDGDNLDRLAVALQELDARIRIDQPPSPLVSLPFDGKLLGSSDIWDLTTQSASSTSF